MRPSQLEFEDLQLRLLSLLNDGSIPDTREIRLAASEDKVGGDVNEQAVLKSALDSLAGKDMLTYKIHAVEVWHLSPEGQAISQEGSPEFRVWQACTGQGASIPQLQV
jgi:phenylalanyl-tRNA synthetase alpha chain